ncbi:MAG: hypothetical protein RR695_11995, partial [Clostridium sp.]
MSRHLNMVFWGMLIVMVDINLGFLNIFPNFVGYFIIYKGLKGLSIGYKLSEAEEIYLSQNVRDSFAIGILPAKIMAGITFIMFVI